MPEDEILDYEIRIKDAVGKDLIGVESDHLTFDGKKVIVGVETGHLIFDEKKARLVIKCPTFKFALTAKKKLARLLSKKNRGMEEEGPRERH